MSGRTNILNKDVSLQTDNGAVLWSIVQGEQLEFAVSLDFIPNIAGYIIECLVIEADNTVTNDEQPPEAVKQGGIMTPLNSRIPAILGSWNPVLGYNAGDVVPFDGLYYKLSSGLGRVSSVEPDQDSLWEEYVPNKLYVQFPSTLSKNWSMQPTPLLNMYGFFELAITEPVGVSFRQTWKPMRGMVEMLFSPTEQN